MESEPGIVQQAVNRGPRGRVIAEAWGAGPGT